MEYLDVYCTKILIFSKSYYPQRKSISLGNEMKKLKTDKINKARTHSLFTIFQIINVDAVFL